VAAEISAALALHAQGRFAEAEKQLRSILVRQPRDAEAHNALGMVLGDLDRLAEAVASFRAALALQPNFPFALHNLGIALLASQQAGEAEQVLRQALALVPHYPVLQSDLGDALAALGRWDDAEALYRAALAAEPRLAMANLGLGNVLRQRGDLPGAEFVFREALKIEPTLARARSNLGLTLFDLGRPDEAERCFTQALEHEPALHTAHANFAHVLMSLGRLEEAERSYRRALELKPTLAVAHSNLALLLNHLPDRSAEDIYAQHREFDRRFGHPAQAGAHGNGREPERRLRIGYVSADLRHHSVAFFIAPLLARHDKSAFEVFCYYDRAQGDATTRRLRSYADHWSEVHALHDDALAELIRRDRIDVLLDLAGHTANNRLRAFARKPAPVQATWLGYLNTTGLDAIDWRITDKHATPEGPLDRLHSEKLARLPDSQWCYEPPAGCPAVSAPPSARNGFCTFAAFSTPAKINDRVIAAWSRLLRLVPDARLMIVANGLAAIPSGYRERFTRLGVDERRLQILTTRPFDEYLALHGSADVVLDTFPYAGGTTTCHALWMGVPVVSLAGGTATSRGGASLLHTVGLPDLVAENEPEYLSIAAALAAEPRRLASLRVGMRDRMRASPLMDSLRFAQNFESACRAMWREWCASGGRG
jgi:predicted O-linked N-acetylglucosamine transferase (SPINDLY family)